MRREKFILSILCLIFCVSCSSTIKEEIIDIKEIEFNNEFDMWNFGKIFNKNFTIDIDTEYKTSLYHSDSFLSCTDIGFMYSKVDRQPTSRIDIANFLSVSDLPDLSYVICYESNSIDFNYTSSKKDKKSAKHENFDISFPGIIDCNMIKYFFNRQIFDMSAETPLLIDSFDFSEEIYANLSNFGYVEGEVKAKPFPFPKKDTFLFNDTIEFDYPDGDYAIVYDSNKYYYEGCYYDSTNTLRNNVDVETHYYDISIMGDAYIYASIIYAHVENSAIYLYSLNDIDKYNDQVKYKGKVLFDDFYYMYDSTKYRKGKFNKNY